jgi:lysozyme
MTRMINEAGLGLIKSFEGIQLSSYQDVAGIWSIGYGHTQGVTAGMQITEQEASALLQGDLASAEVAVERATANATTTDNQFAAMVSLCFNIGSGNFVTSTVLREHVAGQFSNAADAFLLWNKAVINGILSEIGGLTHRRNAERALYLS